MQTHGHKPIANAAVVYHHTCILTRQVNQPKYYVQYSTTFSMQKLKKYIQFTTSNLIFLQLNHNKPSEPLNIID